ncbi:MAG: hypothetical protein GY941_18445 [Planctomycetes bacterium]|nr:hypothetical protein [Planctomycetota bacterium]
MYVGTWQDITAPDIVALKRKTDRIIYSFRPFFSYEFFESYQRYMKALFRTNRGWGKDAGLKTKHDHRSGEPDPSLFMEVDNSDEVHKTFFALLDVAARELNLKNIILPERPPKPPEEK